MSRILIVDDEASMRRILSLILAEDGHEIIEADTLSKAIAVLGLQTFDVVLTDQRLPDGDGLRVLDAANEIDPAMPVIMVTAYATVELAVEALRHGAFDFIAKPFVADTVRAIVKRASERVILRRENTSLKEQVRHLSNDEDLLGNSEAMKQVREYISRVAPTNSTALITGETGTGKELAARAVHKKSTRADKPFIALNCAALTESLLESELFGHERGAFTGADRARVGLFEAADGGTLFLDEAGEMSLPLQAKLLRVLTDGHVQRVGARTSKQVNVRLIVATHRDLPQRVKDGSFREDLYYRIAVVPITMPPLRKRMEDLPLLIDHLLRVVAKELKQPVRTITQAAIAKLESYDFPGNIRELKNLIERACILAHGSSIVPNDLPLNSMTNHSSAVSPSISSTPESLDMRAFLEETERRLIIRALENAHGVQAEAARRLGLSRSDLAYKLRKYSLQPVPE